MSSLIKPDPSIIYNVFIISKDNPLTWNPIFIGNNQSFYSNSFETNDYGNLNQYNYDDLYQKYESLKKEYNELKKAGFSVTALDSLRRELKEKEDKINKMTSGANNQQNNQIMKNQNYIYNNEYTYQNQGSNNINMGNVENYDLRMTYDNLVNENYDLKNQLYQYQTQYNQQNDVIYLDNNFNKIRDSISSNNQVGFNQALDELKTDIDIYTQNNYNTIISMKNQEIERWKMEEKLRKEKENQELKALIKSYDNSLIREERENAQLKMRLKELEGQF